MFFVWLIAIRESEWKGESVCAGYVCFPVVGNFLGKVTRYASRQARKPKPTVGTLHLKEALWLEQAKQKNGKRE